MHHKRRRPKNARSGCLMCKPWKGNRAKGTANSQPRQELEARLREREQLDDSAAASGRSPPLY